MLPARNAPTSAPSSAARIVTPILEPRVSGVRELLDTSSGDTIPGFSPPPAARVPNIPVTGKSAPPLPSKARRAKSAPPPPNERMTPTPAPVSSTNTMAMRVEEIRAIVQEVTAREAEAKKAARLRAVSIRLDGVAGEESGKALQRMFPHLVRPSPVAIALRVLAFLGYLTIALWRVSLRALRQISVQAREGIRDAWMRAATRDR